MDSSTSCCNLRKGVEDSVNRDGPTAPSSDPHMQRMVDAIQSRTGKSSDATSGMETTGSFRQPWDR